MYILEPLPHETIWGGNRILHNGDEKKIGHLYMVNGHEGLSNIILNGKDKGRTLRDLFDENKAKWNLSSFEEFPLTIALVDASDNLSIQVHPDDIVAKKLENKKIGKKESWIFLQKPKDGWIYAGCSVNTTAEIEKSVAGGTMEHTVGRLSVENDDYVCISAGTLHAMTAGSLVYEIEYGSDFTYRFFDYNRLDSNGNARELHIDKALKAVNANVKPKKISSKVGVFSEDVYEVCRRKITALYENESDEIECISVLSGNSIIDNVDVGYGMSLLLFPGEKLDSVNFDDVIVARIKR